MPFSAHDLEPQMQMSRQEHLEAIEEPFQAIPDAYERGYQDARNRRAIPHRLFFRRGQLINVAWLDYKQGYRAAKADLARQPQLDLF